MLAFEWLVVAYIGSLGAMALASLVWSFVGRGAKRRGRDGLALGSVAAVMLLVWAAAHAAPLWLRVWLANLYLVCGYWIPALLVPAAADATEVTRFEAWLTRSDVVCRSRLPHLPRVVQALTEMAYLLCYPLVPLAFLVVWWDGSPADGARFWMTVLLAGFASYASLPWLVSRPPKRDPSIGHATARLNRYVLARVSHSWTTFPSGHVAVSCAAALAVARVSPLAGTCIGVIAIGVSVGAAAGRYHYVIDVLVGVVVALVAVVIT